MRIIIVIAILLAMTVAGARACGTVWPPKVLQEADASQINPVPQDSTIAALHALTPPSSLPYDSRIAPTEFTVFRLRNVTLWYMHTSTRQRLPR